MSGRRRIRGKRKQREYL